jgi:hypothetical protein
MENVNEIRAFYPDGSNQLGLDYDGDEWNVQDQQHHRMIPKDIRTKRKNKRKLTKQSRRKNRRMN